MLFALENGNLAANFFENRYYRGVLLYGAASVVFILYTIPRSIFDIPAAQIPKMVYPYPTPLGTETSMISPTNAKRNTILYRFPLFLLLVCVAAWLASCTSYRDPRAEVSVSSNRPDAAVYLVPTSEQLPKPLTTGTLKPFYAGKTSDRGGVWIHHGYYWIVLEKDGKWSNPVEFEVRLDYLNKIHVDF